MSAAVDREELARISCAAAARIIAARMRIEQPHRSTVRRWTVQWCDLEVHYVAMPGRFLLRPAAIEKILVQLAQAR